MVRIALFGEPGSGKTSVAREISKELHCGVVEASKEILFPAIRKLTRGSAGKAIDREEAREAFSALAKKISPDFIAKELHEKYADSSAGNQGTLFSGLRGIDNARYCRLHNDFVVYLKADKRDLVRRLCRDRRYSIEQAEEELRIEQRLYSTKAIEKIADFAITTSGKTPAETARQVILAFRNRTKMCRRCVNTAKNPAIAFDRKGYCSICNAYIKGFRPERLKNELDFLKSFRGKGNGMHDVLVGVSGGKDSTAALYNTKKMGFSPLAFTFNLGYLPGTTIPRAREVAKLLNVAHEIIDIRKYIRKIDLESYKKTIGLYELPFSLETKMKFKKAYSLGRKHYSIKCKHSPAFVRSCQLCRRMVVRAYYGEAVKRGINAIILGMNEWTRLSSAQEGKKYEVSGVRKLQPAKNSRPVYVFHLPFLLQMDSKHTKRMVNRLGWKPPAGEEFIESNSNSCLFARSTERMAKRLLEFHPDATRLAREVTVGFITKKQALRALGKIHPYKYTPRQVLERAGILKREKSTTQV